MSSPHTFAARTVPSELEFVQAKIAAAIQHGQQLQIRGSGSKDFLRSLHPIARDQSQPAKENIQTLQMQPYQGVIDYRPGELVITVKAGTLLSEVQSTLAAQRQMLGFEPPQLGPDATIGGAIASALAGPRALVISGVRDFVLGIHLIDGRGEYLRFGGQVMKNVAGYDVSRLLCGSRGRLGVICDVSLKVISLPRATQTVKINLPALAAHRLTQLALSQGLYISGSLWRPTRSPDEGELFLRISGSVAGVTHGQQKLAAMASLMLLADTEAEQLWSQVKNQQISPWINSTDLWRIRTRSDTELPLELGAEVSECAGRIRWYAPNELSLAASTQLLAQLRTLPETSVQVWRSRFASELPRNNVRSDVRDRIETRIYQTFDPHFIFAA